MRMQVVTVALGLTIAAAMPAQAQTAADGQALFNQRCGMCHTPPSGQPHGIGPNLHGVVGRKAASTDFPYSTALKGSGLTWDTKTLDKFLAGPGQLVPGTRMVIAVSDPKQRAAVVAYLASLKK